MLRKLYFFFFALLFISISNSEILAQEIPDVLTIELSSPRQTVETQLKFLQPIYIKDINKEKFISYSAQALNNPNLPTGLRQDLKSRTRQLKAIFDGIGEYILIDKIPNENDYADSTRTNPNEYVLLKVEGTEIYLERVNGKWYYSVETIKLIPSLYDEVYIIDTAEIQKKLGLGSTQWFAFSLFLYILGGLITFLFFTFLFNRLLLSVAKRMGFLDLTTKYLLPVAKPLSVLVTLLLLQAFTPLLNLSPAVASYVQSFFKAMIPIFAVLVIYNVVNLLNYYFDKLAAKTESTLDDQFVPLITKALKILVICVGILFVLQNYGFNITGLVAGLSIGGLAIALAAKDTLQNFFGSVMIFVDRPFQIGDLITGSDIIGTVEEVGFRSTRIRTPHNSLTSIPNGNIANMTIDNLGRRERRRFKIELALTYDTPVSLMETYIEGLKRLMQEHPLTIKDRCHCYFSSMGDVSLNVLFYTFFDTTDWTVEMKAKQELMFDVMKLAETLGVRFAFPTTTIHIEDFPEKKTHTPTYTETKNEFDTKMNTFFEEKNK